MAGPAKSNKQTHEKHISFFSLLPRAERKILSIIRSMTNLRNQTEAFRINDKKHPHSSTSLFWKESNTMKKHRNLRRLLCGFAEKILPFL